MTPLERAARAMADNQESHELNWEGYVHCVRAVMRSIREPSEAMMKAAEGVNFISPGENDSAAEWRAMIDAMLEEAP